MLLSAIARSLIEAQGGQISISSDEGAGTVVRIAFPLPGTSHPAPEK